MRDIMFNDTPTLEIYTLSLHDALPILSKDRTSFSQIHGTVSWVAGTSEMSHTIQRNFLFTLQNGTTIRSEEHTSELQSHHDLVCRLLLENKNSEQNPSTRPCRTHAHA